MNWQTPGFEKNKKYLEQVLKNGKLSHAYLFCGSDFADKKGFTHDLFRLINKISSEETGIYNGDPDFKVITPRIEDEETRIYIEDIRDLKLFLSLRPYSVNYKFAIINDADRLTPEASNAILKILEEPSASSVIFLLTSKPKLLLPTIVSRCERINFFVSNKEGLDKEAIKSVEEFIKIFKQGVCERMQYAEKVVKNENCQDLIINLILWFRAKDNYRPDVLKKLLRLNYLLSQPQFNHRLALENFLINI